MGRYLEEPRLGYEDLEWAWWQGIVATALAAAVLVYLSGAHPFVNGYFRNVGGQLDLWFRLRSITFHC
jgi:hypothetical protein